VTQRESHRTKMESTTHGKAEATSEGFGLGNPTLDNAKHWATIQASQHTGELNYHDSDPHQKTDAAIRQEKLRIKMRPQRLAQECSSCHSLAVAGVDLVFSNGRPARDRIASIINIDSLLYRQKTTNPIRNRGLVDAVRILMARTRHAPVSTGT